MSKRFTLTLLAIIAAASATAQHIGMEEARTAAIEKFREMGKLQDISTGRTGPYPQIAYTARRGQQTHFYVFNCGGAGGFVIVSAHSSAAPILGYAERGNFIFDSIPDNLRWWLKQYQDQIHAATNYQQAHPHTPAPQAERAPVPKADVPPMLTTRWNIGPAHWDDEPNFNSKCPMIDGEHCETGALATAMGQIMKYHRWPQHHGTGSHSYTWDGYTVSADFEKDDYRWDNMADDYAMRGPQAANDVATLLHHVGVSLNMRYDIGVNGGSIASCSAVPAALIEHFGYDKSVACRERMFHTTTEWEDLIYLELSNGRPVLYSGTTAQGAGQAFVCDGYRAADNTYHINWGWGGGYDGYYVLTATSAFMPAKPANEGQRPTDGYYHRQACITGIRPEAGLMPHIEIRGYGDLLTDNATVERTGDFMLSTSDPDQAFFNMGATVAQVVMGARLVSKLTGHTEYVESNRATLGPHNGQTIRVAGDAISAPDTYIVSPAFHLQGDNTWRDVLLPEGCSKTVEVTLAPSSSFFLTRKVAFSGGNRVPKSDMALRATLRNDTGADITTNLQARMFRQTNKGRYVFAGLLTSGEVTLKAGQEQEFTLTGHVEEAGTYVINFGCLHEAYVQDRNNFWYLDFEVIDEGS